ncbi:MAG: FHA domain-containing protein [Acidimicrobiales bacterium]
MAPHLEVWGREGVTIIALDSARVAVGRANDNDVVIDDAATSRRHLVFERLAAGWSVRDLGSTNGTTVNGAALTGSRPLYRDDQIVAGQTKIVYRND